MNDTSREFQERYRLELAKLSPEERVKMSCSMFEFARDLVVQSIRNETPDISQTALERAVLERFYGGELNLSCLLQGQPPLA